MPGNQSSDDAEAVIKYQKIMPKLRAVAAASLNLAMTTQSLLEEPGVKDSHVKEYCKLLQKLTVAEQKMIDQFTTDMMDELLPVGVEAMKKLGKEDELGHCTCGRQERPRK